jgi:hypothetical protein
VVVGPTVVAVASDAVGAIAVGSLVESVVGVPSAWAISPTPANVALTLRPVATTFEATAVLGRPRAISFPPAAR